MEAKAVAVRADATLAQITVIDVEAPDHKRLASEKFALQYEALAKGRREDRVRYLRWQTQDMTKGTPALAAEADPDQAAAQLRSVNETVETIRCYDAPAADDVGVAVGQWSAAMQKAIADEMACRSSPDCVGRRLAKPLCTAIDWRKSTVDSMAAERRNPSGYVDVRKLHDLGETLQEQDSQIAELKAQFLASTHRAFRQALCTER